MSAHKSARSNTNTATTSIASAAGSQETAASNAFLASQMADQTEATAEDSMLGLTANTGPRVTGSATAAFNSAFPNPDWAVVPGGKNCQRYTLDTVKVLSHVKGTDESPPAWYEGYTAKNNVGHVTGQSFGTALAFHLTASFGVKCCAKINPDTGEAEYFLIEYSPGQERDHHLLRDENGEGGLALGLVRTVQAMKGVIDFLSPADNLIQAATNTNLDVFSDDFGASLGLRGQLLQLLQAGVETLAVAKAGSLAGLAKADRFAMGLGAGIAVGEPALKVLVDLGVLSEEDSHYMLAVAKLAQTLPALNNILKSGLSLSDGLAAIQSISQAGDEAAKAWLGEAGYKEYWEKNAGIIDESVGGLNNMKTLIDAVEKL